MERKLIKVIAVITTFLSLNIYAYDAKEFDKNNFLVDKASEKSIIVDVYANWCPTCKAQGKYLTKLFKNKKYSKISVYKLDFDNRDQVQAFSKIISKPIPRQSTIVVFKNGKFVAMSVAETGEKLKNKIDKAL